MTLSQMSDLPKVDDDCDNFITSNHRVVTAWIDMFVARQKSAIESRPLVDVSGRSEHITPVSEPSSATVLAHSAT